MKLPAFPVPEPGETVASVVARHLRRTAGPKTRSLSILGLRGVSADSLVPPQLGELADVMPAGHPWEGRPDQIVKHHTLVPLYLHFAHPRRAETLLEAIQANSTSNTAASLGVTVAASRPTNLVHKFCFECVEENRRDPGFSFVHREHQPSFVRVCALHGKSLVFSCSQCLNRRNALSMWRMAGLCDCETPQLEFANRLSGDATYQAGALFLAEQAKKVLNAPTPTVPLAELLRIALIDAGFSGRAGLDINAIHWALLERYGTLLLSDLHVLDVDRTNVVSSWPSRILDSTVLGGEQTPDVLRCILLAGLVADDISALYAANSKREERAPVFPHGYSQARALQRDLRSSQTIESALQASGYRICAAAKRLRTSPSQLAVDMMRQGMSLPLSPVTEKRLGRRLIDDVSRALQSAMPKKEIQRTHNISEWTLQLIELAFPELREAHRETTIERQRETHRNAILSRLQSHPSSTRSDLAANCTSACDWLRRFDREWLESHLPKPKPATSNGRGPRINWPKFDQDAVAAIRIEVQSELNKSGRPARITATRLLSAVGALSKRPSLIPRAIAEAKKCAESEDAYLRRRIEWAVRTYADRQVPVSMNQLRRVAALSPDKMLPYSEFIQEMVQKYQMTIDMRCVFSPQRG